ncbi:9388_t:CDS:1, partial [Entrophospora sp. SA101]
RGLDMPDVVQVDPLQDPNYSHITVEALQEPLRKRKRWFS